MSHDPDTGEVLALDFAELLSALGKGEPNALISQKMAHLCAEVERVGDGGSITMSFKVAPKKPGSCMVTLKSCKTSLPMEPVQAEAFWHTAGGGLSRVAQGPPKQPEFSFDNVTPLDKGKAN
jgi:hypothetical protein